MKKISFPPCALSVTDQVLSDWLDQLLTGSEASRMAAHIPTCAGCQARLAGFAKASRALQQQPVPVLQTQIWRGMQARLMRSHPSQRPGRVQYGLYGAIGAILLIALFAFLLAGNRRPSIIAIATQTPVSTSTTTPVALSSPTANPTTAQMWGSAGMQLLSLDARQYDIQAGVPDEHAVLAVMNPARTNVLPINPPPTLITVDTATGSTRTIYSTSTQNVVHGATDGRYIVWAAGFNETGGPGESNVTVGYLDTQTGQTRTLINNADNPVSLTNITVTHGMLIMPTNNASHGVYMANLATGAQQLLLPPAIKFTVSWPYLLMEQTSSSGSSKPVDPEPTVLVDLTTGQQTDLTALLKFSYYASNYYALDGSSIFITQPNPNKDGTTQFVEIDQLNLPAPQSHVVFTLPVKTGISPTTWFVAADSRLLLIEEFSGNSSNASYAVWDRVLQKLLAVPATPAIEGIYFAPPTLQNGYLDYWQSTDSSQQFVLWDEAALPNA